jgi:hypothetical protein
MGVIGRLSGIKAIKPNQTANFFGAIGLIGFDSV